jgi:hypothetical protein
VKSRGLRHKAIDVGASCANGTSVRRRAFVCEVDQEADMPIFYLPMILYAGTLRVLLESVQPPSSR